MMSQSVVDLPRELLQNRPEERTVWEEAGYTLIHCTYVAKAIYVNGGWINIWPSTWLEPDASGDRLLLLHALEIPLAPARHYFKAAGQVKRFTLVFPQLPESWDYFTLKEQTDTGLGFVVSNIRRNSWGVYHVTLQ